MVRICQSPRKLEEAKWLQKKANPRVAGHGVPASGNLAKTMPPVVGKMEANRLQGSKSSQCNIPKPILEAFGNPTGLTFVLKKGGVVEVRSWNKTKDRQSATKET